jgi:succinoglycan biosynthesis protein ExoU
MIARRQAKQERGRKAATADCVSVIIPAWNSANTIARAVQSALNQPEVAEVVVVDDCSDDGTVAAARSADDGSGRLEVLVNERNRGPAASRNRAIGHSRAPFIAPLDADDFFLDGRFSSLFEQSDWDAIADNVMFVEEGREGLVPGWMAKRRESVLTTRLGLVEFIEKNISVYGRPRRELGFMKPLIRRSFLEQSGLAYQPSLRLGEDYALYAAMLARGARFICSSTCGYVAVERSDSLSSLHSTSDLANLLNIDREFLRGEPLGVSERRALERHRRHLERKHHHRQVLDCKRRGIVPALWCALRRPSLLAALFAAILRDKLTSVPRPKPHGTYLFD